MSKLILNLSDSLKARLNPYKRLTKGTTVNVTVDGVALEAVVDNAGKYSYLNVGGVDYYVTAKLEEGMDMTTSVWEPKAKPAPKEPKVDEDGNPVVKPAKKARKPKAPVVDETPIEEAEEVSQ